MKLFDNNKFVKDHQQTSVLEQLERFGLMYFSELTLSALQNELQTPSDFVIEIDGLLIIISNSSLIKTQNDTDSRNSSTSNTKLFSESQEVRE